MNPNDAFKAEVMRNIEQLKNNRELREASLEWVAEITPKRYAYNFNWLGRPIIQVPQDMVAIQELVWRVRPDLIVETGIAHGGSLIMSASLLAMLDYCDAVASGELLDLQRPKRRVLGIDIDIREHNREAILAHPMSHRIDMLQGSSIAPDIVSRVHAVSQSFERVMVLLDSNHTHDHVLGELQAYAPLVTSNSYCVVFDTVIDVLPHGSCLDRPWDIGNNPMTAVREFLRTNEDFVVDEDIEAKLLITVAPHGYLRRKG
ncbi:cephalosporin hydroxylase family protein [Dokdonella sp.]|uniref:cephalosporin hydroxylase family protein n=1 Tax=Dokdonella sp. TaxID=2291710 RepID=UPI0035279969